MTRQTHKVNITFILFVWPPLSVQQEGFAAFNYAGGVDLGLLGGHPGPLSGRRSVSCWSARGTIARLNSQQQPPQLPISISFEL